MAAPRIQSWQRQLLAAVGAPVTGQNLLFVNDWARAEGGGAANNPFNTTQPGFGATGDYNSVGVKNYGTPQQGIAATAATLKNGRYVNIVGALRQGTSAKAAAAALAASPWGTGSLVERMLGGGSSPAPSVSPLAQAAVSPPAAAVQPAPDFRPQLASQLAVAAGTPTNDLQGFYTTLTQALRARQAAQQPQTSMAGPVAMRPPEPSPGVGLGRVTGATGGENPAFLNDLARLAAFEHAPVAINSGYRSQQQQQQLWDNRASNPNPVARPGTSLHQQGLAADGTIGGKPLGTLPPALLAKFGLMPVPGDPVHVQILR